MNPHPRPCPRCQRKPVAHPKAVYCYDCRPYHRRPPPPCRRCGSPENYYTNGLCARCHKYAPPLPDSCPHCWSWGLFKSSGGICQACQDWRVRNRRTGPCSACGQRNALQRDGLCRLCYRRAHALARLEAGDQRDTRQAEAVLGGHQLFLDNMEHALALTAPAGRHRPAKTDRPAHRTRPIRPVAYRQGLLFELVRDLARICRADVPPPPLPELAEALDAVANERGGVYGWTGNVASSVRRGLHVVLAVQDTPGAPVTTRDLAILRPLDLPVLSVREVLASVGMFADDGPAVIAVWFERQIQALPTQMAAELRVWFTVMREGSTTPPRMRPRTDRTIRNHLTCALPALRTFADRVESLREISRQDVVDVLPAAVTARKDMLFGLRSIFRILKGRRLTFVNPTAGIRSARLVGRTPLPLDVSQLRDALDPTNPPRAALASLLIFHGVRPRQLRSLRLTDVRDGRLHFDDRVVLLAPAVTARLAAYLDVRSSRWPRTANPHLFLNPLTATRTSQVSYVWVNDTLGMPAHRFREDRILDEIHATGGDLRRASDMFGLTIPPLLRYLATLNHADLDRG